MYKIKIKALEIENIVDTLIDKPFFTTKDNVLARRVGVHLSQMRKDGKLIIANDRRTGETFVALKKNPLALPEGVLKIRGRRTTYEFGDFYFI